MNFNKAYVIGSKDFAPQRLNSFYKNIKSFNMNVNLWPAINGSKVNIEEYKDKNYLTTDFQLNMPGSLGCLLSHITLWEYCEQDNDCDVALIFEDDAILYNNFLELLDRIPLIDIPSNWNIIKLSYKGLIGEAISNSIIKPKLVMTKGTNAGNWCYLLNTKNVSKLKEIILPYDNKLSIDVIMRNNIDRLNIFFTSQKLAKHYEKKYSLRKDLNNPNKSLLMKLKFQLRKYFRS
tara:strand:- start:7 stop:708 length:702 start_codon:yes stop_codon:yes gene_type:complete